MSELKRTQLYDVHVAAGAEMVDFGGWEMPIQYPSGIIAEHLYTRQVCSLFAAANVSKKLTPLSKVTLSMARFAVSALTFTASSSIA